jgi:predicted dehydrogenase
MIMNTTRRDFLGRAGAGAIVYKLAGARPQLKAASKNDQIGLGFIGVGIRGTYLLEAFQKVQGVRPVIAADLYDGHHVNAKEITKGAIATTRDYHKVIGHKDVDAVVIATPDHWHHRMTLEALAAGKPVYVEKPMTWSIEQGMEVVAATEKSGKLLMVGSGAKTSPLTAKAREIVKSGALGKVNMVRMLNHRNNPEGAWVYAIPPDASPKTVDWERFLGDSPKRAYDPKIFFRWRCWWEYSGGVATDLFVHELSQLHEIMDVPAPVSAVSQGGIFRWDDGRSVPDVMNSVFEYEPGFLADVYVNLGNSQEMHGTLIMGSQGTLALGARGRRGGAALTLYPEPVFGEAQRYGTNGWPKEMRKEYFEALGYTAEGRPKAETPKPKPQEIQIERGLEHHEYFIKSLRDGSPSMENATEGHHAAGAAHLANLAYRKGRRMRWDPKTGAVTEG